MPFRVHIERERGCGGLPQSPQHLHMSSETTPESSPWAKENKTQTKRNQLSEDVYNLCGTSRGGHEGSKALKQEHEAPADQREASHKESTTDPLHVLPAEMWIDIVREAIKGTKTAPPATDALLLLTLVSLDWRIKLVNTPGLWTDITIGKGEADAQAKLETILWLSKDIHLILRFIVPSLQWPETLALLQPQAHRIRQVIFIGSWELGDPAPTITMEFLHNLFPSLGHLPSLQVLQGHIRSPMKLNWHDIFSRAPNLRYVYALHVTAVPLEIVRNRTLRACTIDVQSSDVLENLGDIAHVEELSWSLTEDGEVYNGVYLLPSLPELRKIHSYGILNSNFFRLLKLAGNVDTLKISIKDQWRHLYDLFNIFDQLPHLRELEVYLHNISEEVTLPPMNLCRTHLRDLKISNYRTYTAKEAVLDPLFTLFPVYFPKLQTLDLNFITWDLALASCIKSLSTLWFLRLSYIYGNFNVSIDSPSLQYLIMNGGSDTPLVSLMNSTKCSSLLKLELSAAVEEAGIIEPPEPYYPYGTPPLYFTTETLEIGPIHAQLQMSKFNTLRKLIVGGQIIRSCGFLVNIIIEPCICPELVEIELQFVPEWDLLFLMLERRNSLPTSQGISQIKTLTLPSPIPLTLLAPLTAILGGRVANRPSNWDLSFCGFMEEYFDPDILGCDTCLTSMMACTRPLLKAPEPDRYRSMFHKLRLPGGTPEGIATGVPTPMNISGGGREEVSEPPGAPAEVWEWLRSREERLSRWMTHDDAWINGKFRRAEICAEMEMAQKPFSVTQYSLSDLSMRVEVAE